MNNNFHLNVVFIGPPSFPLGKAISKRRRYLVDYMNMHGIQSHVLVSHYKYQTEYSNPYEGIYGIATYKDITCFAVRKHFVKFYIEGIKMLRKWFIDNHKNILIFTANLSLLQFPFYLYAKSRGYKIVFDQVEASFILIGEKMRLRRRINEWISDRLTTIAMNYSASFVISTALEKQSRYRYPNMKICILPNATPSFKVHDKTEFHHPLRVVYSGTFASKDGVSYLIKGVKKAVAKGCDLELRLLGKGDLWDMKVLDELEGCSWSKYLGFVSDEELIKEIQNADVLCMTRNNSLFANYGFPFKLSEYLATGNIVLATNVSDISKYLNDCESAYIVPPENSEAIAEALYYIHEHEKESLSVAQNGYEVMCNHFSIDVIGKTFIEFICDL